MSDDLDILRRTNPVTAEALEQAVSMDRTTLIEALEADGGDRRLRLRLVGRRSPSSTTRVGYLGAIAAAAAVLVGFVAIGGEDPPTGPDMVDSADEILPSTTSEAANQGDRVEEPIPTSQPLANPGLPETTTPVSDQGSTSVAVSTPTTTPASPLDETSTTAEPVDPVAAPTIEGPFDRSLDLLVLHYDHAHLDDGHAAVAALEIATHLGLATHVVAGTVANGNTGFVHDFAPVMQAVWGDAWFDANTDRSGAANRSVERWLRTLDAGGRVWVADGGASDFTAEVVGEIQRQRPDLDTRAAIRVVQHNERNESESTPENLSFLRAATAYERIDDGNSANRTADLNMQSEPLVTKALAGPNGTRWSAAFEYLPADELDFSDTVEVLHILGIGIDEVADPDDFANRFMG